MADDRLFKYVQDALVKGYEEQFIIGNLTKAGFDYFEVEAAIATAKMTPEFKRKINALQLGKTEERVDILQLSFFQRIYYILFKPVKFFSNIGAEEGVYRPLFFYSILVCFSTVLFTFFHFFVEETEINIMDLGFFNVFSVILLSIIVSIAAVFAVSALIQFFVSLFRGEKFYFDTFRVVVYSATPGLIFSAMPFINALAFVWALVLYVYGLKKVHNLSFWKAVLAVVLPLVLVLAVFFIMSFIVRRFLIV